MKLSEKKKFFLTRYTTVSVMLVVLVIHLILIRTVHISPWKGGGFGMFSTLNTPESHIIMVYDHQASGEKKRIIIPGKLKPMESKIRNIALGYYIDHFKQAIQKEKWVEKNNEIIDTGTLPADSAAYRTITLNKITVEIWRYKFDPGTKRFYSTFIAQY